MDNSAETDGVDCLGEAVTLLSERDIFPHELDGQMVCETQTTSRLTWCCYVQDRIASLFTDRKPSMPEGVLSQSRPSLEDFNFHHLSSLDSGLRSGLPADTLGQIYIVSLFKLKFELSRYLSPRLPQDAMPKVCHESQMRDWHSRLQESESMHALKPTTFSILRTHYSSLLLLHGTVDVLMHKKWIQSNKGIIRSAEIISMDDTVLTRITLKLRSLLRLASEQADKDNLRHYSNGGSWALIPLLAINKQVLETAALSPGQRGSLTEIHNQAIAFFSAQFKDYHAGGKPSPTCRTEIEKSSLFDNDNATYSAVTSTAHVGGVIPTISTHTSAYRDKMSLDAEGDSSADPTASRSTSETSNSSIDWMIEDWLLENTMSSVVDVEADGRVPNLEISI